MGIHGRDCPSRCSQCLGAVPKLVSLTDDGVLHLNGTPVVQQGARDRDEAKRAAAHYGRVNVRRKTPGARAWLASADKADLEKRKRYAGRIRAIAEQLDAGVPIVDAAKNTNQPKVRVELVRDVLALARAGSSAPDIAKDTCASLKTVERIVQAVGVRTVQRTVAAPGNMNGSACPRCGRGLGRIGANGSPSAVLVDKETREPHTSVACARYQEQRALDAGAVKKPAPRASAAPKSGRRANLSR